MNIFSSSYRDSMITDAAAILEDTPSQELRKRVQNIKLRMSKNTEKMRDTSLDSEEKSKLQYKNNIMSKEITWLNSKLNAPID